jgi:hypothetical protein
VSLWTAQRSCLINIHERLRLKFKNESASDDLVPRLIYICRFTLSSRFKARESLSNRFREFQVQHLSKLRLFFFPEEGRSIVCKKYHVSGTFLSRDQRVLKLRSKSSVVDQINGFRWILKPEEGLRVSFGLELVYLHK